MPLRALRGSPAHAGIDLRLTVLRVQGRRFPRTRGDRPATGNWPLAPAVGSPAHAGIYLASVTSLPHHPGFPADLAKLLTFNFQRSTDNGNLKNDISLLLPPNLTPHGNSPESSRQTPTLDRIPPAAFTYRLDNRAALEWIIDQHRIKTAPPAAASSTTPAAPATPTTSRA